MGKDIYDGHHRVPESRGGLRSMDNMLHIKVKIHQAFHMVFTNDTPIEQVARISRINGPALSDELIGDIHTLLHKYTGEDELYAYREGVLVPRKFIETMK